MPTVMKLTPQTFLTSGNIEVHNLAAFEECMQIFEINIHIINPDAERPDKHIVRIYKPEMVGLDSVIEMHPKKEDIVDWFFKYSVNAADKNCPMEEVRNVLIMMLNKLRIANLFQAMIKNNIIDKDCEFIIKEVETEPEEVNTKENVTGVTILDETIKMKRYKINGEKIEFMLLA